ncbi:MAG: hypothetical protein COB49_13085 [Alphaproteobacteria bacterium]|nr:MAG: hypothetical protein COB49_13085 [Alphaproteobacteria bacterium]
MQSKKIKKMILQSTGLFFLAVVLFSGLPYTGQAKTWLVGPEFLIKKPSTAIKRAKNGDVIKIVAGIYENDYSVINQDNLILEGMNGFAHLKSTGRIPGGKAIWVINGKNISIRNIEFSGAHVPDKNGAGIRLQRGSLTLDNCYFHGNEMGILTGNNPDISLFIENSEFSWNRQDYAVTGKLSHNIYVGTISVFVMENSVSRGAKYGHTIKSRAWNTIIRNNRVYDEGEISASYLIDIPNGGNALIENNYLYKNKGAQNNSLISYGTEGMRYEENSLTIRFNTAVNEEGKANLLNNRSTVAALLLDNKLTRIKSDQNNKGSFWNRVKQKLRNILRPVDKQDEERK